MITSNGDDDDNDDDNDDDDDDRLPGCQPSGVPQASFLLLCAAWKEP